MCVLYDTIGHTASVFVDRASATAVVYTISDLIHVNLGSAYKPGLEPNTK
jgi:hypothetical protein